jgi:hypothetical protein
MKFAAWLEDQKDGAAHFRETIDFLLAESKQGHVNDTGTD